jgi:hypothetical protein
MGHAAIDNKTPLAVAHLFLADEEGRSLLVTLAQATFLMAAGRDLTLAEPQEPPSLEGELWGKDAAVSSYKIEPAFAFHKPATDIVLNGHAQERGRRISETQVTFRVGPVGKVVRVVGDRFWIRSGGVITATRPQPFERIPLLYENAFGGWDRSHADPARHTFEPRNPVGTGFRAPDGAFEEGIRLPNLEDPANPIERHGQIVAPSGLGFTSPNWQPRAALAGTYNEAWLKERMPLLPKDFDRRFFNAASPDLIAPGYLTGNEPVLVENASPMGRLSFRLPSLRPPACRVELSGREDARLEMRCDTIIIDADEDRVVVLYRGHLPLRDSPHDVRTIALEEQVAPVRSYTPWQPGASA